MSKKITLNEAISFHGHLGPYLVLGLLAGEFALKKLKAKKYFEVNVIVWGANKKPKSCLIDGLQLSTGATYGKGNIKKINAPSIKMQVFNKNNGKKITLKLKKTIAQEIEKAKSHIDSETLAKKLFKKEVRELYTEE
jgi:formylmethanofuran dehydrogenase subunit E